MKNIRETLSNALVIGGLLTTVGSAVDAVRTNNNSQETQQKLSITENLKNEFHVREDCDFTGVPSPPVCSDHVEGVSDSAEEELVLDEFRNELVSGLQQVPPDERARRRLTEDVGGMIAGAAVSILANEMKDNLKGGG